MKFYHAPHSCSMAAHICLEETGATYEAIAIDLAGGEHKRPEFRKIHKRGQIPALMVDEETVIIENLAIQNYIAKRFPEAHLAPRDTLGESRWLSMLAWIGNTLHPSAKHVTRTYYYATDEAAYASVRSAGRTTFWNCLKEIDEHLEGKQWILGDQYTTADTYVLPFLDGTDKLFDLPFAELPHLMSWQERMLAREAVRTVLFREQSALLVHY